MSAIFIETSIFIKLILQLDYLFPLTIRNQIQICFGKQVLRLYCIASTARAALNF